MHRSSLSLKRLHTLHVPKFLRWWHVSRSVGATLALAKSTATSAVAPPYDNYHLSLQQLPRQLYVSHHVDTVSATSLSTSSSYAMSAMLVPRHRWLLTDVLSTTGNCSPTDDHCTMSYTTSTTIISCFVSTIDFYFLTSTTWACIITSREAHLFNASRTQLIIPTLCLKEKINSCKLIFS